MLFSLIQRSLLKCFIFSVWTVSESYCFIETAMRTELSLRGFCWVEAMYSHFPFTLQKTHYCGIGHRPECNLFYPNICLVKKAPRLFAVISSFWSMQLILRSLQCVPQTILEINSQSHSLVQKSRSHLPPAGPKEPITAFCCSVTWLWFLWLPFSSSAQPPAPRIALALTSPTSNALNLLLTPNFPVLSL